MEQQGSPHLSLPGFPEPGGIKHGPLKACLMADLIVFLMGPDEQDKEKLGTRRCTPVILALAFHWGLISCVRSLPVCQSMAKSLKSDHRGRKKESVNSDTQTKNNSKTNL